MFLLRAIQVCSFFSIFQIHKTLNSFNEVKDLLYSNSTQVRLLECREIKDFIAQNYSIVYFGTPGCKACVNFELEYIRLAETQFTENKHPGHEHHVPYGLVNILDCPEESKKIHVKRVPIAAFYHRGIGIHIPESHMYYDGVREFVERRIHLKKLPVIHTEERLREVITSVPHALVLVCDGGHKADIQAKHLFRYLQFGLFHFHLYTIENVAFAQKHGLEMHGLYEINKGDQNWKRIQYEDLIEDKAEVISSAHFDDLKRRIYSQTHPKVQFLTASFFEYFGLDHFLVFVSRDSVHSIEDNENMKVFNDSCSQHLYLHTRCVIFNQNVTFELDYLKSIFHVPLEQLQDHAIIHFRVHNRRRETFLLQPSEYSSPEDIISFFHKSANHSWPLHFVRSEEIPKDNEGKEIKKLVAYETWRYFENPHDILVFGYNSSNETAEEIAMVSYWLNKGLG